MFKNVFIISILKIFEFSFNLDQSQVCISNRLKVTASQRQLLFWAHDKIQNHKKNRLLFLYLMKLLKTNFQPFCSQSNLTIFEFSFILDQSQVCISNGLEVIAHQSETLIVLNSFSLMELWKRFLTIFTLFFTRPKCLKIKNFFFLILKA